MWDYAILQTFCLPQGVMWGASKRRTEKGGGMKQGSLTQTVDVFETPKKHSVISHLHPHHVLISELSFHSLQTLTQSTQSTKCTINIY
jgi:hypothetical protein